MSAVQVVGRRKRGEPCGCRWRLCVSPRALWTCAFMGVALLSSAALAVCVVPRGDVDGNGAAAVSDVQCAILVTLAQQAGQPMPACASPSPLRADVDCSGVTTVADVQLVIQAVLGQGMNLAIDSDGNACADTCDAQGCASVPAGLECDDGDPCTTGEHCAGGLCIGTPLDCDDGNSCTVDECNEATGQCESAAALDDCCSKLPGKGCAVQPACEDCVCGWNPFCCSTAWDDLCGKCAAGLIPYCRDLGCDAMCVCNDGCSDDSPCTTDERCESGECVSEVAADPYGSTCCSTHATPGCDTSACTICVCQYSLSCCTTSWTSQCASLASSGLCAQSCACAKTLCDDGNPCTSDDACEDGECIGHASANCDDFNSCTQDLCDISVGCVHVPLSSGSCNDGNNCTEQDHCAAGVCVGTDPGTCDDGIACTDDYCLGGGQCSHFPSSSQCSDGNPCTKDACSLALGCTFTAWPHPDSSTCCMAHGGPGGCDTAGCASCVCPYQPSCCTTGGWTATCAQLAASLCSSSCPCAFVGCDDGNPCTTLDHCSGGSCAGTLGSACNDGNPCTTDTCTTAAGCQHLGTTGASCDDGDACTLGDHCVAGECIAATTTSCDDGIACTDDFCTFDGGCGHFTVPSLCDDGDPCTVDSCQATSGCVHAPKLGPADSTCCATHAGPGCSNTGCQACVCVYKPSCCTGDWTSTCAAQAASLACSSFCSCAVTPCDDGDACTVGEMCSMGQCQGGAAASCDDDNPCTKDDCVDGGCIHVAMTGPACDDGDACTEQEHCESGQCVGTSIDCDDGNPCTQNVCNPKEGCLWPEAPSPCCYPSHEPGCIEPACESCVCAVDPMCCEVAWDASCAACAAGQGGTPACAAAGGCANSCSCSLTCSDGKACTGPDVCVSGQCLGPAYPQAVPSNCCKSKTGAGCSYSACEQCVCNKNSGCCLPFFGTWSQTCADIATGACLDSCGCSSDVLCDDANPCSTTSECVLGTCKATQATSCSDGNPCTLDGCSPSIGCTHTPVFSTASCCGKCNQNAGTCWCDAFCVTAGDCCPDACSACGLCL